MNDSGPPPLPKPVEPITIEYCSTFAEHWRCNIFTVLHNRQFVLVMGGLVLLTSVTIPLPRLSANPVTNAAVRFMVVVAGFGILNLAMLLLAILKRIPKTGESRMCVSSLTAEGMSDVTPGKTQTLPWKDVTSVRESKGDIHVWLGVKGVYIPCGAFHDLDEARRFYQMAFELWQSKGLRWPEISRRPWRKAH